LTSHLCQTFGFELSTPFVDATLPDGSRLHVAIPDITRQDWAVNIRKFVLPAASLEELGRLGTVIPRRCASSKPP
jgi:pilus assembly protein CpaF